MDIHEHEDPGSIIQSKGDALQADVERGQLRNDGFGVGAQRVTIPYHLSIEGSQGLVASLWAPSVSSKAWELLIDAASTHGGLSRLRSC